MIMDGSFERALASQRVDARGHIAVEARAGGTVLKTLFQEGAAKIRVPAAALGGNPAREAVLINTAGGLTGGDRLDWLVEAGAGSNLTATTQACEKVYRSAGGTARTNIRLDVRPDARIAWLPQETIIYERSALERRIDARLARGGRLLLLEAVLFGRLAHGEELRHAMLRDSWRIFVENRLVHAEEVRIGPAIPPLLNSSAGLAGARAMASVVMVGPDLDRLLPRARAIIGKMGAASFWTLGDGTTGKLLARLVASDGYTLRKQLLPLLHLLNNEAELPRIWTM